MYTTVVCLIRLITATVCDDRKLLLVHIILIVIGVIVYISGMCVAVYLGVVLFKKASSCFGMCIMYCMWNICHNAQKEQQLHVHVLC